MFDETYVWGCFLVSLNRLRERDSYLLENRVWEGSLAHRLAVYLEPFFPQYFIDCEYDKSGEDRKALRNPDIERLPADWTQGQRDCVFAKWTRHAQGGRGIRPDIIVHIRGEGGLEENVLAIECKHEGVNANEFAWDWCKLQEFTSGHQAFRYQMGILVIFEGGQNPSKAWVFRPDHEPELWLE
jgi:hypothetical protein